MVIWIRRINELNKEGALMVESIGKRLKKLRIENGYTQNQIAEYLELKQNDISKLEHNMKKLKGNHMLKLSNLYGCPMEYIALGIDKYYNNLKQAPASNIFQSKKHFLIPTKKCIIYL